MQNVIGYVKLAYGQVGYFDQLTRIHLTIANNTKPVFAGMNTINLKNAVASKRIMLISGTLDMQAPAAPNIQPINEQPVAEVKEAPVAPVEESGVIDIKVEKAPEAEVTTDENKGEEATDTTEVSDETTEKKTRKNSKK
jgi:hypothetical protein